MATPSPGHPSSASSQHWLLPSLCPPSRHPPDAPPPAPPPPQASVSHANKIGHSTEALQQRDVLGPQHRLQTSRLQLLLQLHGRAAHRVQDLRRRLTACQAASRHAPLLLALQRAGPALPHVILAMFVAQLSRPTVDLPPGYARLVAARQLFAVHPNAAPHNAAQPPPPASASSGRPCAPSRWPRTHLTHYIKCSLEAPARQIRGDLP